jgi:hypothetical protein
MNYDDWKLSNPIDDGYGYDMLSNCCGAKMWDDCDICPECKEHCEVIEDYEYEAAAKEAYAEMKADGERDEGL